MNTTLAFRVPGILCLLSASAFAQIDGKPLVVSRSLVLSSGRVVTAMWRERACHSGECLPSDGGVWGVDGEAPQYITEEFAIKIDKKDFVVPSKFFRDITNVKSLRIEERNGRPQIVLRGGDAAGAFHARFVFGGCGFERIVCGEVCSEIEERSRWRNSFVYDGLPGCTSGIK